MIQGQATSCMIVSAAWPFQARARACTCSCTCAYVHIARDQVGDWIAGGLQRGVAVGAAPVDARFHFSPQLVEFSVWVFGAVCRVVGLSGGVVLDEFRFAFGVADHRHYIGPERVPNHDIQSLGLVFRPALSPACVG